MADMTESVAKYQNLPNYLDKLIKACKSGKWSPVPYDENKGGVRPSSRTDAKEMILDEIAWQSSKFSPDEPRKNGDNITIRTYDLDTDGNLVETDGGQYQQAKYSVSTLDRWMRREGTIYKATVKAICKTSFPELSVDWLLGDTSYPFVMTGRVNPERSDRGWTMPYALGARTKLALLRPDEARDIKDLCPRGIDPVDYAESFPQFERTISRVLVSDLYFNWKMVRSRFDELPPECVEVVGSNW